MVSLLSKKLRTVRWAWDFSRRNFFHCACAIHPNCFVEHAYIQIKRNTRLDRCFLFSSLNAYRTIGCRLYYRTILINSDCRFGQIFRLTTLPTRSNTSTLPQGEKYEDDLVCFYIQDSICVARLVWKIYIANERRLCFLLPQHMDFGSLLQSTMTGVKHQSRMDS